MIAHVVLFRPRPDLAADDRHGLGEALTTALRGIPSIRRLRVGRRVTHGRGYEQMMRVDYPYAALLEFDDVAGLTAYLEHPAHAELGTRFFAVFEDALMYDYDLREGDAEIRGFVSTT
jgi:hypothetical protein